MDLATAVTNCFMCTGECKCKKFCLWSRFICLTSNCTRTNQTEFERIVAAKILCCSNKYTWSNLSLWCVAQLSTQPVHTEWFALRLVAATCRLLCLDLKSYHTAALVYLQSDPPVFPEPAVLLFQHVLLLHQVVLCLLIKRTSTTKPSS